MALGCCNSFKECSDAGRCIHETDTRLHGILNYKECLYKENLDKGLNFYTEYNENNQARAEEYKAKIEVVKLESVKDDKKRELNSTKNKRSKKNYIEIPNRLFYIGKRGKYNGYTYSLSQDEQEELISETNKYGVNLTDIENPDKFIDETLENNERCNCKIVIVLKDEKYNISNYDHKGLKKETAVKIASYLINKGINAEIEEILNFSGSKMLKSLKAKEIATEGNTTKEKAKIQKDIPDNKVVVGQMTFFDIENIQKSLMLV